MTLNDYKLYSELLTGGWQWLTVSNFT